jgi:hypothetical protein
MSALARKKVTIQYRKLDDFTGGLRGKFLQDVLAQCMQEKVEGQELGDNPALREFAEDGSYGTLVLNTFKVSSGSFFGEIVRYEPGADLPLLRIAEGQQAYDLTQAKAPDGHEPVRGVIYFLAVRNHVMLLQGDVSASRAERYFSWLLTLRTNVLSNNTHIVLLAEFAEDDAGKQLKQVQEIFVRPRPLRAIDAQPSDGGGIRTLDTTTREIRDNSAVTVLRAAGIDETDIFKLADNADTQLEVTLQIRLKGRRNCQNIEIEDANRLLRNIPDDELTLIGPGGKQRDGKIIKLSYPANVECKGSILETTDVARALLEAYKYFESNGYID